MNKAASIYSAAGAMVYQYGNSRTICASKTIPMFQVQKNGAWVPGRNRHALATIDRVKQALAA